MSRGGTFYDSPAWHKLRARVLARQKTCQAPCCDAPSARVDHIVSIGKGGAALDINNLQALCARCHNAKTARLDGGFGHAKRNGPAWGGTDAQGQPLDPGHHWNRRGG